MTLALITAYAQPVTLAVIVIREVSVKLIHVHQTVFASGILTENSVFAILDIWGFHRTVLSTIVPVILAIMAVPVPVAETDIIAPVRLNGKVINRSNGASFLIPNC